MGRLVIDEIDKDNVKARAMGCKIVDYKVYKHNQTVRITDIMLVFALYTIVMYLIL